MGASALRVTCGQAHLCEANLPGAEDNMRADIATGLRSEMSEGHPESESGMHAVFTAGGMPCCWYL